ncbi:MAG TPA: hypothetical protein VKM72_26435 [Thermoanaerobaculia bacterium]|nr:hypothetical protein [Thermoanaerobaculia bacterium]
MLVDLGHRQGLVQLVHLVFVGALVDEPLVDEGLEELLLAPLHVRDLPLGGGFLGGDVGVPGFPVVQDDGLEEGQELGPRPHTLKEAQVEPVKLVPRDVRLAAAGVRRAVVVGIPLALALRPGAGEGVPAVAAGREASQREVRVVALPRHDLAVLGDQALDLPEGVFIDQGRPVAHGLDVPGPLDDPADVGLVHEHLAPFLGIDLSAPAGAKAQPGDLVEDLDLGVQAGGEALEAEPDQRGALGVELQGLAVRQVAQRRPEDPLATAQGFLHAGLGPAAPDIVVELGEGRENALHELAGRRLVDRLGDGSQGDAEPGQVPADDGMVEGVAGESVDVGDHKDVGLDGALVLLSQVGQGRLQLGTVGRLGGLAALHEDVVDLPAVGLAEGPALLFLDGEGEVEGLFFAADAAVDDRPQCGHLFGSLSGTVAFRPPWARKQVTVMSARP